MANKLIYCKSHRYVSRITGQLSVQLVYDHGQKLIYLIVFKLAGSGIGMTAAAIEQAELADIEL